MLLSDYLETLHHAEHKVLLVHVAGLPSNFDEASEFSKHIKLECRSYRALYLYQ